MKKERLSCLAELEVVNIKSHESISFDCDLEYGHEGSHQAKGTANFYPNRSETECHDGDYVVTWTQGMS